MGMIERNGFWWPENDDWCYRVIHDELPDLDTAIRFARGHDVAVQAGGNVGVWAAHLAKRFARVETVEPDTVNYACLVRNVPTNVNHRLAGFGDKACDVGLVQVQGNAGAHYVGGDGSIPLITIDSLNLDACNLLCLDIEGHEPHALRGAEQTIRKYRPVVMFEEKGLSERYFGIPAGSAERWVADLGVGYKVVARVRKDVVMACA